MSNTGIIVFVLVIIGIVWLFCMTKNVQNEKKYKNMNEEEMKSTALLSASNSFLRMLNALSTTHSPAV